jgi:hypothetical protein
MLSIDYCFPWLIKFQIAPSENTIKRNSNFLIDEIVDQVGNWNCTDIGKSVLAGMHENHLKHTPQKYSCFL